MIRLLKILGIRVVSPTNFEVDSKIWEFFSLVKELSGGLEKPITLELHFRTLKMNRRAMFRNC